MRAPPRLGPSVIRAVVAVVSLWLTLPSIGRAGVLPAEKRAAAPPFALVDSEGRSVRLADLKGKTVLINFWATWCHGCQTEIPWFVEFQKEYRDRGLAIVGISMDEDGWRSVRPYLEEKKLNYPVVIGDSDLAKAYGLGAMPRTVLVDRDGKIAAAYDGVVPRARFERDLRNLLGTGGVSRSGNRVDRRDPSRESISP